MLRLLLILVGIVAALAVLFGTPWTPGLVKSYWGVGTEQGPDDVSLSPSVAGGRKQPFQSRVTPAGTVTTLRLAGQTNSAPAQGAQPGSPLAKYAGTLTGYTGKGVI